MKKHFFKPGEPKEFNAAPKIKKPVRKSITIMGLNGIIITSYDKAEQLYYDKEGNSYTESEILKPKKKK